MPYTSVEDIPEYVKNYSPKIQRQWFYVFNSTWKKITNENGKDIEKRAFQAANSVLKKRFSKGQNISQESHRDYFNQMLDKFLGRLEG